MATNDLANPVFHNEAKAREWLEAELWPDGPFCPHCGSFDATGLKGSAHRAGLYQCNGCRKQFTVTVGSLFERSKIPLTKWLMAMYLLSASKKGVSTKQLSGMLGLPYKTAWFMTHRIREAMREGKTGPLGGANKVVEAVSRDTLRPILFTQIDRASYLMTDEAAVYKTDGKEFAGHGSVNHSIKEYVHGSFWHTNTVESYFAVFKRGITGNYQWFSTKHLKRYLGEFDFRYNTRELTNMKRTALTAKGIQGKRLTYKQTSPGEARA